MKRLQILPRKQKGLYGAMIKRQDEIRRSGRGTFSRVGPKRARAARWKHARYKGSLALKLDASEMVSVSIRSHDPGDEARLLSAFLGWIGRHFDGQVQTVIIEYR